MNTVRACLEHQHLLTAGSVCSASLFAAVCEIKTRPRSTNTRTVSHTHTPTRQTIGEKDDAVALASRQQESYLRKESQYRQQVGNLEDRIQTTSIDDPTGDMRMAQIRSMHHSIQETIGGMQNKTSRILQDQERDLIRAFRARLADVTDELDKERKKNENGSVEWVQRCRKLTEELEWLRDLTDKLTTENKNCLKENRRHKRQLKTQEEDREFLIKQLVAVKKENARLQQSFEVLQQRLLGQENAPRNDGGGGGGGGVDGTLKLPTVRGASRPQSRGDGDTGGGGGGGESGAMSHATEARYTNIINRLRRQLETEKQKHSNLRSAFQSEVGSRTQLQFFLKKCIEDVRADIAEKRNRRRRGGGGGGGDGGEGPQEPQFDPRTVPLEDFSAQDRINVMEWLLSQDHVIYMLYDKMFPAGGDANDTAAVDVDASANSAFLEPQR
jgi:hypothetical protein